MTKAEKVLFCDIGNVLLYFDLFKSIARLLALGKKPAASVLPAVFHSSFIAGLEIGKVQPKEFWRDVCELFGVRLGFESFCDIWTDIFKENLAMTLWIKEISARHRVFLISNSNVLHCDYVRGRYDFFRYVSGQIMSHEVGLRKPDPRIFCLALKKAGVSPGQAFYLDDVWAHVFAARRCGMRAEHFSNAWIARRAAGKFLCS